MTTTLDDQMTAAVGQVKDVINNTFSTLIVFVLDESGSMSPLKSETIKGFNEFIEEQKAAPGKAFVSLTLFNNSVRPRDVGVPLETYPPLLNTGYRPKNGTALYDAIGVTVTATEKWIANADRPPTKVLFVIITDGEENSSTDFDAGSIAKLIDKKQEESWDFTYLGANQDAILTAKKLNIPQAMASNFTADSAGATRAFRGASAATTQYRSSRGKTGSFYDGNDL